MSASSADPLRRLWKRGAAPESGRSVDATLEQAYLHHTAWAPDGKTLAGILEGGYELQAGKVQPIAALATVNADGSGLRRLTTIQPYGSTSAVSWSPDGSQLVFVTASSPKSSTSRLEIVNADGSGRRVVAEPSAGGIGPPSWSPDGRWIAFSAGGGYYDKRIEAVHPDGSKRHVIARGCSAERLAWSPDGAKIAFDDDFGLVVMNTDGSGMSRVANTWYAYHPTWSADGKRIAFFRR